MNIEPTKADIIDFHNFLVELFEKNPDFVIDGGDASPDLNEEMRWLAIEGLAEL